MSKSREDGRRKPFNSTRSINRLSRSISRSIRNVSSPFNYTRKQLYNLLELFRKYRDKTKGSKSNTKTRKKIEEIEEKPKIKSHMKPVEIVGDSDSVEHGIIRNPSREKKITKHMKPVEIVGDSDSVEDGIIRNPSREKKITKRMEPTENTQEKSQDEDDILKTGFDFGNKRKTRKRTSSRNSI